jgi:hypothetical protein
MVQKDSQGNIYDGITNLLIPKKVAGDVHFERRTLDGSLYADPGGTIIEGSLSLDYMQIKGDVNLKDVHVKKPASLGNMSVGGYINLHDAQVEGSVAFFGTRIGGFIDLQMRVKGSLCLTMEANSADLRDLQVKGDANLTGLKISGHSVLVEGMQVGGAVLFDNYTPLAILEEIAEGSAKVGSLFFGNRNNPVKLESFCKYVEDQKEIKEKYKQKD